MPGPKKQPQKRFVFRARVEWNGVQIVATGATEEEARAKAEAGDWEEPDISPAEPINWRIDSRKGEVDE